VQIISPYAGGGFGQKNSLQNADGLAAVAAPDVCSGRSACVSRAQIFHDASLGRRAASACGFGRRSLGPDAGAIHEVDAQTRAWISCREFAAVSSRSTASKIFVATSACAHGRETPRLYARTFEHGAMLCHGILCRRTGVRA